VDEFDKAIQVLRRDGLVLLIEIVHITIEYFDEELDGNGGVHAGVRYTKRTLEAFEDAFAVSVEL
jgi:hypothetical protein